MDWDVPIRCDPALSYCKVKSKPSELIELRHTLTQLNDAVTQVARSGNLEQANRVRDLLVQVKREIYKLLAEQ